MMFIEAFVWLSGKRDSQFLFYTLFPTLSPQPLAFIFSVIQKRFKLFLAKADDDRKVFQTQIFLSCALWWTQKKESTNKSHREHNFVVEMMVKYFAFIYIRKKAGLELKTGELWQWLLRKECLEFLSLKTSSLSDICLGRSLLPGGWCQKSDQEVFDFIVNKENLGTGARKKFEEFS